MTPKAKSIIRLGYLSGPDGNGLIILGNVKRQLKEQGYSKEDLDEIMVHWFQRSYDDNLEWVRENFNWVDEDLNYAEDLWD